MKDFLPKLAFVPFILALLFSIYTYANKFFQPETVSFQPAVASASSGMLPVTAPEPVAIPEPSPVEAPQKVKPQPAAPKAPLKDTRIQVALLLDVSGSMSGLIEQAKSQLWKVVNELSTARYEGTQPQLEIALYEYGNNNTPSASTPAYMKQIVPLTTDLDLISEALFSLQITGSSEFCGEVIQESIQDLKWSGLNHDLKMIFIAGNEAFTQGPVNYASACKNAIGKGIVVNTIFCGDHTVGINSKWKDGADLTDGKYMSINHNEMTAYIESPFDKEITELNARLNNTYIAYGSEGRIYQERQQAQDKNAGSYSAANMVDRTISKSSGNYRNEKWDLVDFRNSKGFSWKDVEKEALPEELKELSNTERDAFLKKKEAERKEIQEKNPQTGC